MSMNREQYLFSVLSEKASRLSAAACEVIQSGLTEEGEEMGSNKENVKDYFNGVLAIITVLNVEYKIECCVDAERMDEATKVIHNLYRYSQNLGTVEVGK